MDGHFLCTLKKALTYMEQQPSFVALKSNLDKFLGKNRYGVRYCKFADWRPEKRIPRWFYSCEFRKVSRRGF